MDLNRAGTPLLEIVTEPDLNAADEVMALCPRACSGWSAASASSEANMQKGQMRFEPNINLHIDARRPDVHARRSSRSRTSTASARWRRPSPTRSSASTRNGSTIPRAMSWSALGKQNRGWDDDRGETVFQREKEEAHDYRYFPDPDLLELRISQDWIDKLKASIGELPAQRQRRYVDAHGLSPRNAEALTLDHGSSQLFEAAVAAGGEPVRLANLLVGKGSALANQRGCSLGELGLPADRLAALSRLLEAEKVTSTSAARLLEQLLSDPRPVDEMARALGLVVETDAGALRSWVEEALAANPQAREDAGTPGKKQAKALGFLVGQVMQRSRGAAPPQEVQRILRQLLGLD